ncbi:MAG: PEGA domain-containing protein [Bacteroidetes bacterium]|nr:PEGA domain-containing protein [Bacteroidota bacterium]
MKTLLFLSLFFLPALLFSQSLREFDLQEMSEQQIPVFIDHPNDAALIFYTAINGLTLESSTGGVVSTQSDGSKFTVFLKPERQILKLKAPGFIEKKLSIDNLSAKQAKFYRLNTLTETYTAEKGTFLVNTQLEGAMLRIDGFPTFKQLTPFELKDFEAKKYRIAITKPDYYPLDTLIEIRQGIKQSGLFQLRSMYGTLSLKAPLPVKVKVNSITQEIGPELKSLRLTEGVYTLNVDDPRFEYYRETVTVPSGGVKIVDLPLIKKAGYLQILHPDGFELTINGETRVKKPGPDMMELFHGSYRVEVKRPGFQPVTYSFLVKKGDVINWEPVFTPVTVKVSIQTAPAGATIQLIRGTSTELLGFSPVEEQVAVGDVEFLIKREGFNDFTLKAKLEAEKPFKKNINLANPLANEYKVVKVIKYGQLEYNGFTYKTVVIGTQEWTVENLNTTRYNDGTAITKITDGSAWSNTTTGAYCANDNTEKNVTTYGYLYNWYAVNTGKLAPKTGGWRVPTDADWTKLTDYVGGEGNAGGKLKAKTGWNSNGNGSDDYGFSALPGGVRYYYGVLGDDVGYYGYWWSSTPIDTNNAWVRSMGYNNALLARGNGSKSYGWSVRLVRDVQQ